MVQATDVYEATLHELGLSQQANIVDPSDFYRSLNKILDDCQRETHNHREWVTITWAKDQSYMDLTLVDQPIEMVKLFEVRLTSATGPMQYVTNVRYLLELINGAVTDSTYRWFALDIYGSGTVGTIRLLVNQQFDAQTNVYALLAQRPARVTAMSSTVEINAVDVLAMGVAWKLAQIHWPSKVGYLREEYILGRERLRTARLEPGVALPAQAGGFLANR